MKVFVAGGTGAVGKSLLPLLLANGHQVVALVRSPEKVAQVETLGAQAVLGDAFDRDALTAAIEKAEPDAVIHQLTALAAMSGVSTFKKMDQVFARTNRLRTEVTDTMLAAARHAGARRFIAQSFCGWPFAREGAHVKTEEDALDPSPPASFRSTLAAIRYLEEAMQNAPGIEALALRYGFLYGPGTSIARDGEIIELVRRRQMPIVGNGAGIWSFTHVRDAAQTAVAALSCGAPGIYNVVDDEPAPVSVWLPYLASVIGARPPLRVPAWLARPVISEGGVSMMTEVRGASNAKAKRELGWQPEYPSWRRGFVVGLG